eukprot:CAMPEP_0201285482 /NCGR_PEP_ID=MMETSP1317-20130820/109252_1 /ASSEMBLY_ACC=CAM_ASM_000770 /TAXON_ID=187299 /ORGANISM="Undescribed Undescribed, Strain Undescribed" /LENGTH=219 /DNA_ID=CAMNT_0047610539 /DNA_START=247 /DNA_END=906 /DNA_ORIENTATION=-
MTLDVMKKAGVHVDRNGYEKFFVRGLQKFKAGHYEVEPDSSCAGYFWGAAAITGTAIKVKGIRKESCQGDVEFVELLGRMGCKVIYEHNGITVAGKELTAIEADMSDMPDMVPTLSVVAAFAKGVTVIKNVFHLKTKESDRLIAIVNELKKININASCTDSEITIVGGKPSGTEIKTYDDHRIAMSFAMAGLKTQGIIIKGEKCVKKSFPNFWNVFNKL